MRRKQFTFYQSFHESIQDLKTKTEKLAAYEIICNYALYGWTPDLTKIKSSVAMVFKLTQPVLATARQRALYGRCVSTENNLDAVPSENCFE